jgi:adenylate cyclase class IV
MVESKDQLNLDRLMSSEEKEVKLSVSEATFNRLLAKVTPDAKEKFQFQLTDTYYDDSSFLLTNLNRGLRIRSGAKKPSVLEFKSLFFILEIRPNNPWLIEEKALRLPIDSFGIEVLAQIFRRFKMPFVCDVQAPQFDEDSINALLKRNGLDPRIVVSKNRTEVYYEQHTFSFDQIQDLGFFIEVETHDASDPITVLNNLGDFTDYKMVREGYNDMIAQQFPEVTPAHLRQARFVETPSWNILPGEEEVIRSLMQI